MRPIRMAASALLALSLMVGGAFALAPTASLADDDQTCTTDVCSSYPTDLPTVAPGVDPCAEAWRQRDQALVQVNANAARADELAGLYVETVTRDRATEARLRAKVRDLRARLHAAQH